jgi:ribosomal protein L3 glutamine methyltransferase
VTLPELVAHTARQLTAAGVSFGHGTANAHDEAAWLVLHALGLPLDTDLAQDALCGPVTGAQKAQAAALLQQRIAMRRPLAYLTRQAWLQGVPFYVDERSIVPRSLIAEVLAADSIDPWLPGSQTGSKCTHRVLDLCTGGGSLAVLAALAWPETPVDAADISADALAVARINIEQHGLRQRIALIESDGLKNCAGPYDLILCNPPYVNTASMAALPPEYRAEPALALAGGADGMDFVRRLIRDAPAVMNQHAALVLEIGHERAHFEAAFPHLAPLWLETSAGGDQVLLLAREDLAGVEY